MTTTKTPSPDARIALQRATFESDVRAIAAQNLVDQRIDPTPEAVERQMLWLASLYEAEQISGGYTMKDLARMVRDGLPALTFEDWVDGCFEMEDDEEGTLAEVLDALRLF